MIENEFYDLFKDGIDKQLKIVSDDESFNISNSELHWQGFELHESLCSQESIFFGSCEASMIKFTISNTFISAENKKITASIVLDKKQENIFQIGKYKVKSDKPTADLTKRNIVAYDAMYDILNSDVSNWYNNMLSDKSSTCTLKQFRDSFFEYFGIEQEEAELVNDNMIVQKTIFPEELSGATVITCICEINGCFGHIGRNGKFQYIYLKQGIQGLYPSNELYPADNLFPQDAKGKRLGKNTYIKCEYENYTTKTIEKLQIRKEENDIGVIVGDGDNCYIIQDNFLVYGKGTVELTNIANNILDKIVGILYRPFKCNAVGNPCLEVGDPVRLTTKYELVETYILQRTLTGIQGLRDEYTSTGEEYYAEKVNGIQKSILQLKGKTNTLVRNVEETRLQLTDVERNLQTQITVNAEGLTTKVSKDNIISEINQTAEAVTISAQRIDLNGLVTATEFTSRYATIGSINAVSARVGNLEADHVSVAQLNATNATVSGKLSATDLETVSVTAQNLTVKSANVSGGFSASKITSGTISTDRLDVNSIASKFTSSNNISVGSITSQAITTLTLNASNGCAILGHTVSWKSIVVGATLVNYLGY